MDKLSTHATWVIFWEHVFLFFVMKVENLMLVEFKENIPEGQTML